MSNIIDIYRFKGIDLFYSDMQGNFYLLNGIPIKKQYHNGRNCIRIKQKRYGLKTLRKLAYKSYIVEENLPF